MTCYVLKWCEIRFVHHVVIKFSLTILLIRQADCYGQSSKSPTDGGSINVGDYGYENDFYIDVRTIYNFVTGREIRYYKNDSYNYDNLNNIELTCKQSYADKDRNLTLEWKDNNGFVTRFKNGHKSIALRLIITPDTEDVDLEYTCKTYYPKMESITIKLVANSQQKKSTLKEFPEKLRKGAPVVSTCNYTVVRFPNGSSSVFKNNVLIINKFEETYTGTIKYCFKYYVSKALEKFKVYERTKSKSVLYLEDDEKTTTTESHHSMIGNISTGNAIHIGAESDNRFAILGCTLGSIILILLAVIIVIWYRKAKRQRLLANSRHYVIYAEIEERPQHPPQLPPPRTEPPYAQIAGTLMPAEHKLVKNDQTPLYCTIEEL